MGKEARTWERESCPIIPFIIIIIIMGEAGSDYSTSKPHPSSHPAPVDALTTVGQTDVGLAISRRGHPHVLFVHTGAHAQVLLPSSSHSTVDGQALVMGPCFRDTDLLVMRTWAQAHVVLTRAVARPRTQVSRRICWDRF